MKKYIVFLTALAWMSAMVSIQAQSPVDKVFEKYTGEEGFTTVNITKDLIQMMIQMNPDQKKDTSGAEIKSMLEQLNGLKILTYEFDSTKLVRAVSVYNEFAGLFPSGTYKELMSINEGRQNVKFLTKQESSGKISEMVMLAKDKNEVAVLSLTGKIDLSTVSKLSKGLNVRGMEKLSKIKDYQLKHNHK